MHVDQRHVTAISLLDGRERDYVLLHDGAGYRLSLISKDDVVNILLSPSDLQKLRNEITAADMPHLRTDPPHDFGALNGWGVHEPILPDQSAAFAWDSSDWLAYN